MSVNDRLTEKQVGTVKGGSGVTHTVTTKDNVITIRSSDGKVTHSTT